MVLPISCSLDQGVCIVIAMLKKKGVDQNTKVPLVSSHNANEQN